MPWLRIDDGFPQHPKIIRLPRGERWTWLEVLAYCARYRTAGIVTTDVREVVKGATLAFLRRCVELKLLDPIVGSESAFQVHDWKIYNATTTVEKVEAYLLKNPEATANDVFRDLGGKRELVLAAVAEVQSRSGTQVVPNPVPETVPLARAGAPRPTPNPQGVLEKVDLEASVLPPTDPEELLADDEIYRDRGDPVNRLILELDHVTDATEERLREFVGKVPEGAFDYVRDEVARSKTRNPAGLAITILRRIVKDGSIIVETPTENGIVDEPKQTNLSVLWLKFVNGLTWDDATSEESIREDLARLRRKPNTIDDTTDEVALEAWKAKRAERYPDSQTAADRAKVSAT